MDFAEFFRETLSKRAELVSLREELQHVERYLRFEKLRLGDRLRMEYDVDSAAYGVMVPVLAVQPLVENALIHGIAPKGTPGVLRVCARPLRGGFEISVSDDGEGFLEAGSARASDRPGMGVAVSNIHHRLLGLFGPSSGLRIESNSTGTTASFWVPAEMPAAER